MSLSPHPVGYAEARVARLNRESELTDYRRLSSYLVAARGEAFGAPRERLIVIGQSEHYHPTLGIAYFACQRAHFIRAIPPTPRVVQECGRH